METFGWKGKKTYKKPSFNPLHHERLLFQLFVVDAYTAIGRNCLNYFIKLNKELKQKNNKQIEDLLEDYLIDDEDNKEAVKKKKELNFLAVTLYTHKSNDDKIAADVIETVDLKDEIKLHIDVRYADIKVLSILNFLKRNTKEHLDVNSFLSIIKIKLSDDNVTVFKAMTMVLAKEYADLKTSIGSVVTENEENENLFTPQKFSQLVIKTIRTIPEDSLHATLSMENLNFTKPKFPPLPILQQKENLITFIEKNINRFAGLTEQEGIATFLEFLEEPKFIAYKDIKTDKMVTSDAVLKECISRYDPNMTPQRRVIKLKQILQRQLIYERYSKHLHK
uniref:DUF4806 domain-containing protein n=1 Tax=Strongyloides venezuelensis TaxID=75913 RepID=A0A0K0FED9_STRVS